MSDELLEELERRSASEPFAGFRCWEPAEVATIMHREAAAPSRAVLLATHQPPRMRRVAVTDAGRYGATQPIAQEELLAIVREPGDGALIVPIVGASGSGKSHLVLWLREQLEEQDAPHREVIYVPKGDTTLAGVIERILGNRRGGRFDELRQAVQRASRTMGVAEAARRLRDELALATAAVDAATRGPELEPYRRHLKDHLAELLDDPAYATRIVGEGGALRRIVEQALAGASEQVARLERDDLVVQLTQAELEPLSKPARDLLTDLYDPRLHEAALALLNEVLDRCLSRIFGVEPMQLVRVMRDLREQLFAEDPQLELVLMVEDFSLLQGIQHDLLEAMIELPTREGRQTMCAMKTVMAVTRGFFDGMLVASDTLRTRVAAQGHVYDLDVEYAGEAADAVDRAAAADFAARYLNAVRVGAHELERRRPEVPNACDRCAHRDRCHDAFGTAAGGIGLYPFSETVLDRMVRSRQERFSPRDFLSVLAQTLTVHAGELAEGRFPSRAWARAFEPRDHGRPPLPTLPLAVEAQIRAAPKPEQREVLLTFWGGAPETLGNLAPGVHEAFAVPLLADAPVAAPPAPAAPDRGTAPPPAEVEPEVDEDELALRQWRDGSRLDAERARILRRSFREAIVAALDPGSRLLSPKLLNQWFPNDTDVRIANAAGAGRPPDDHFRVDLGAGDARLLEGVLRAQRRRDWRFPDGHELLVAFLDRVDAETARLASFLDERLAERRDDRAAAIALLALAGLAAGRGRAKDTRTMLAAALARETPPTEGLPERWRVLVSRADAHRAPARDFALGDAYLRRGGTGSLSAVDGSRLLPALAALRATWEPPRPSAEAPAAVRTLCDELEARLPPALADAHEQLAAWRAELATQLGDPATLPERAKAWQAALDDARDAGYLVAGADPLPDGRSWQQAAAALRVVEELLDGWDALDLGRRVAAVAQLPWDRLARIRAEARTLARALGASAEKARTQQGGDDGDAPRERFARALAELEAAARIDAAVRR